nr:thioesterase family protein [Psychrobacter pygoscelis]
MTIHDSFSKATLHSEENVSTPNETDNQHYEDENEHSALMNEEEFTQFAIEEEKTHSGKDEHQLRFDQVGKRLVRAFNNSPYLKLNKMEMRFDGEQIRCYLDAREDLIGNVNFSILHGGVAATMLDSVGGIVAMLEIYRRNQGSLMNQFKKISRLATVDLRIDYLSPGRGKQFIASGEVVRLGRKGATVQMKMVNDEGRTIAMGVASFAF